MHYEIKGLNVFNILRYISDSDELLNPVIIPTNIVAGLDENTNIYFSFLDAGTVLITVSEEELSREAKIRFENFCEEIKLRGFEIKKEKPREKV